MQRELGLGRTSLLGAATGAASTRSAAEIDDEYNLHVSLLGLAVMPSNDYHQGRGEAAKGEGNNSDNRGDHGSDDNDDNNNGDGNDKMEEEDNEEDGDAMEASPPPTTNQERFLDMFKATNKIKSLRIESFGTWSIPNGFQLQFIGQYQPIPDGLRSSFTMFGEQWTSQITYVVVDGDTALQFSVCNLRTRKTTSLVETREERRRRQANKRVMLICSKTFDLAWRELEGKQYVGGQRGTKESATLFGLKDPSMRDFVCEWYAAEEKKLL